MSGGIKRGTTLLKTERNLPKTAVDPQPKVKKRRNELEKKRTSIFGESVITRGRKTKRGRQCNIFLIGGFKRGGI